MTVRKYSSVSIDTTLSAGGVSSTATTMTVATGTGTTLMGGITLTAGDIFTIAIDPDTTSEEICYITAQSGDTFTITRARAGTAGVVHAAGATVRHVLSSDDLNYFNQAIQSTTAPGSTPTIVGGSSSAISTKIQVRKDTAANWTSNNPTLASGEIGLETDTGKFKIGDGTSTWAGLLYAAQRPATNTPINGYALLADSSSTNGVKWSAIDSFPSQTGNSGKYLTTDGSSTSWGAAVSTLDITFNAKTGNYTLIASDLNKLVTMNSSSTTTITVPNGIFTTGQQINVQGIGTGTVQIRNDGTTVLTSTGATAGAPNLRAQYSAATIICTSSNNFTVIGDLA